MPDAIGPLMARRRGDMLRAVAGELATTADEAHRLDNELVAAKAENTRLRREMATAMATRPPVGAERGPVPQAAHVGEVTPTPDAAVLQARPVRWTRESDDEWAARCYLHGYRVGHAAGQRFEQTVGRPTGEPAAAVTHEVSLAVVGDDGPVGELRASFTPTPADPDTFGL